MKKKKITFDENAIRETPLNEVVSKFDSLSKQYANIVKRIKECIVLDVQSEKQVIDPFQLRELFDNLKSNQSMNIVLDTESLNRLRVWITTECDNIAISFESTLNSFCSRNSILLDGRYPSYILQGILPLRVIQKDGYCQVGSKKIKSLLVDSIAPTIIDYIKDDTKRHFDSSTFLEQVFNAYLRSIALDNVGQGSPVQIKNIFRELIFVRQPAKFTKTPTKVNYEEYSIDLFSRDLAKLIKNSPNITKSGKRLEFAPTAFSEEGIPVLIDGAVRYVGRISFSDHDDRL